MEIANLTSVNPKHGQRIGQGLIIGRDKATVSKPAQVLAGEKTKAAGVPEYSGALPTLCRPNGLARILNDANVFPLGNLVDRSHVRTLSEEMHRNDSFRARRDCSFNHIGINVKRISLNVHKHRLRAQS